MWFLCRLKGLCLRSRCCYPTWALPKKTKLQRCLLRGMPATSLVSSIIRMDKKGKIWSKMLPPSQNNCMVTVSRHIGFLSPLSRAAPVAHVTETFGIRRMESLITGTIRLSVHQTILLSTVLICLDSHAQEVIFSHIAKRTQVSRHAPNIQLILLWFVEV